LWEAFEEDAHPPPSDVQTGQSIRFSKRRWHSVHKFKKLLRADYIKQQSLVRELKKKMKHIHCSPLGRDKIAKRPKTTPPAETHFV
jgi:hypothetical protein